MAAPNEGNPTGENLTELEWIQLQQDIGARGRAMDESGRAKFARKFKENPFVPIGCLGTAMALSYGLWSFRQGKRRMSQYMMRARIAAQGFTVVAILVGLGMSSGAFKKP